MKNKTNRIWFVVTQVIHKNLILSVGMILAIIGSIVTALIPPLVLGDIINQLVGNHQIKGAMIITYIVLLAVSGIFDAGKASLITIFGQKVTHELRSVMCRKLSLLQAAYFTENEAGIIASRFVNDVDTVETLFDSGVISMVADGCKVIGILVVIFMKSKGLGILMILVTPILMALTLFVQKRMLHAQIDHRTAVGKANNHIPETIHTIRMIHTVHAEDYMKNKYRRYINDGYQAMEKSNFYDAVYSPIIITMSAIMVSVMMIFTTMGGGMQAFFGMSVGTAVAVINYVSKVFGPLESIGMEIQNIQSAIAGVYRINEFLSENERKSVSTEVTYLEKFPAITFDDVRFGYTKDQEILHGLSFEVVDGENVTLTGRTGIGKSTAFKLILGLYDAWKGDIKIYGTSVLDMSDHSRAKLMGYVEQSFHPIQGNVKDQITLKDESVTEKQVWNALELVGLKSIVAAMECGLLTKYKESMFSQGQIQLLSIARAIVHNPRILLLDEITANLDTVTEEKVLDALKKASTGRTVLSISHRVYETIGQDSNGRCVELA